jgi:hypothetical protein
MAMAAAGFDGNQGGGLNGEETEGVMGEGVKPRINCTLMAAIQGGEARVTRGKGRRRRSLL